MPHHHHHKIDERKDVEHFVDSLSAHLVKNRLHDWGCNSLDRTETSHGKTRRKSLFILEPQHKSLYRRKISRSKTNAHYKSVADINADQSKNTGISSLQAPSAVPDEKTGSGHSKRKRNRRNQR